MDYSKICVFVNDMQIANPAHVIWFLFNKSRMRIRKLQIKDLFVIKCMQMVGTVFITPRMRSKIGGAKRMHKTHSEQADSLSTWIII